MRSLQTTRNAAFKAALLAGGAGLTLAATPAFAQEDINCDVNPDDPACVSTPQGAGIIVTGSRILRQDFEANSPFVTVDEALLQNSSTAALESNLNKLPQFVPAQTPTMGGDIQPTATNTPGAATISLRGVGANRNLVLVDGRRATPSNASGVTDISTIPAAAIERIEVISGGASATYGADAVAGVTNFILKKNFQGLELDGRAGITQRGDGFEFQVSGIMGADFDDGRGNISIAMSMNKREPNYQADRPWYRDLLTDPQTGGTAFFNPSPGIILSFGNPVNQGALNTLFPGANPPVNSGAPFFLGGGFNLHTNPDGTVWTGTGFNQRGGASQFDMGPLDGYPWKQTAAGTIGYNNTSLYLILPLTRYNAMFRGNYEINDWIGVFGQAMFSAVNTFTRNEPGPITNGWDVFMPYGTGTYVGSATGQATNGQIIGTGNPSSVILPGMPTSGGGTGTPYNDPTPNILSDNPTNPVFAQLYGGYLACANNPVGGCTNNQAIGQFLPAEIQFALNNRANPNAPFQLFGYMPDDRETFTDVVTYNLTAGLEGSIPGTDWTWEAFANFGESSTYAKQTGVYSLERVQTLLSSPGLGRGFNRTGNPESNNFGASTGTCATGTNFFQGFAGASEDCFEAMRADLKNRSKVQQNIWEANFQGGVFDLPAGQVRAAVGASYRELDYKFDNDTLTTQGRSFLDQALGIYPSGNVDASIDVKEVYGEMLIPIIGDGFINAFNLEVGGRISDYSTTGTSYTYKVLGDLEVTDWLRFRGGYNRAERAPNIGELFLAAQQTFGINNRGDVCSRLNPNNFSANPANNPNAAQVEAVCTVLMNQADPTAATQYYSNTQSTSGFGFAFPTLVGNPNLTPETADTWTAGVVFRSPFSSPLLSRFRLSIDWFDITIHDAIGVQSIGAVQQQCFDPVFNPLVLTDPVAAANSQFCQLLPRTPTGNLGNVQITYANRGHVHLQGIDGQLDWSTDIGPGTLALNALVNYQIDFESSPLFPELPLTDYVGTFGTGDNGLNTGVYEYRILGSINYSVGPARIGLQWQHFPSIEDGGEATTPGGTPNNAGFPNAYNLFHLNAGYALTDNVNLRFGVDNLFDKAPPLGNFNPNATTPETNGQLRGGGYNSQFYDTNGRRFYLGANFRF